MAQSSHNSEIHNIGVHAQYIVMREPRNRDNGASDVWALTASKPMELEMLLFSMNDLYKLHDTSSATRFWVCSSV